MREKARSALRSKTQCKVVSHPKIEPASADQAYIGDVARELVSGCERSLEPTDFLRLRCSDLKDGRNWYEKAHDIISTYVSTITGPQKV